MNIIIPAAGLGNRFKEDNYDLPKPLINVLGTPLIFHILSNLKVKETDTIYIVYNQNLDNYNFKHIILKQFPNIKFITLNFLTRGPVETVLCGLNSVKNIEEKTLILDCDTFYNEDIINICHQTDSHGIFYFKDTSTQSIFSYIEEKNNYVLNIKEKVKITDNACSGAYLFNSGNTLKKYCELSLNKENKYNNEYYISGIYNLLIGGGEIIEALPISNFHCLGTPEQLKSYCLNNDLKSDKKRFCFDLDNTLFTFPEIPGDYSSVKPIVKNIKLLKYLHSLGHTIIIHTARKMKSYDSNVGAATKNSYKDVFNSLETNEVPFDEIYFGKPLADFYIDDLSVKPFEHIEKQLGFYNGIVEPRSFNNIEYSSNEVIKTTNNSGELFWYKNIPNNLIKFFPKVLEIKDNSIKMEKVNGILYSYLFSNNSLTTDNLSLLLGTIKEIHESSIIKKQSINNILEFLQKNDIYANYSKKIKNRFYNYDYNQLSTNSSIIFNEIISKLDKYENNKKGSVSVIHGDLVFSNIFLCENRSIKLIDMRGKIGDIETIYGDIFYDYAKIYQSLCGYDFILNDRELNFSYIEELKSYFKKFFKIRFGDDMFNYLKYNTAGLLFSLIPLHNDKNKQIKYFNLIESVINDNI